MESVIIQQIPVGSYEVFTYIVACPKTMEENVYITDFILDT